MLEQFLNHIERNNLCTKDDRILLAVSGGVDSMVMMHLFRHSGFNFGVAHCNFQLRGEESMGDEALVNMSCVEYKIPFHLKRIDTTSYAEEKGVSIQMAARDLRYQFFEEVVVANSYKYVATAHHLNDNLETVLLNFVRGTGINGLTGIPVKQQSVIRPLLFASRDMIKDYADFHRLSWREDSSNAGDKYHRNLVRNKIVPLLKKINPGLESGFINTLQRLVGAEQILKSFLNDFQAKSVREKNGVMYIGRQALYDQPVPDVVLWELIKDKGFNFIQCKNAVANHQSGKVFYSSSWQLVIDRDDIIISKLTDARITEIIIDDLGQDVRYDEATLSFEVVDIDEFSISRDPGIGQFDYSKIRFPLTLRKWRSGDRFTPLGMSLNKKISDFLIDIKVSLPEKEKTLVLESEGEIIWVVGYRISDRFKVTEETQTALRVCMHRSS